MYSTYEILVLNVCSICIQHMEHLCSICVQYVFSMHAICWRDAYNMLDDVFNIYAICVQYVFNTCSIYIQYACDMRATRLHHYVEHILKVYWTYLPASIIQYMFNTWGLTSIPCWMYIEAVGRILRYIEHIFNSLFNILNNLLYLGSICLQYGFNMSSIPYWTSLET